MSRIKIYRNIYSELREHLLKGRNVDEEAAFLLASSARTNFGWQLIVTDFEPVPDASLLSKGPAGLEIDPIFIARILKKARATKSSVILCHSHPFSTTGVRFSSIDDGGESELFPRIAQHVAGVPHGTIVFGHESLDARIWLPGEDHQVRVDQVLVIDHTITSITATSARPREHALAADALQRQALALGQTAQKTLANCLVAVVGVGGLGSVIAHALARSGVGRVLLIDLDRLEIHNISRVEGATLADIGQFKVDVVKRSIEQIGLGTRVEPLSRSVLEPDVVRRLLDCDVIVVATDNMRSRVMISRVGLQYAIPVVSAGIDLPRHDDERLGPAGGHVAAQTAGTPCLDCLELIDRERLEREECEIGVQHHAYDDSADPSAPEPSAYMFNTTIAGACCAEVCQLLTGVLREPGVPTYLMFDARSLELKRVRAKATQDCGVCHQVRDQGDRIDLPLGRPASAA